MLTTSTSVIERRLDSFHCDEIFMRVAEVLKMDTSPFALRPTDPSAVAQLSRAAATMVRVGITSSTLNKDLLHKAQYWDPFCATLNTPMWRTDKLVLTCSLARQRESILWTLFLMVIKSAIRPRSHEDEEAKPKSVVAPMNAMRRLHRHKGYGDYLVSISLLAPILRGLKAQFIKEHGYMAMQRKAKEFMPKELVHCIFTLPHGTMVGRRMLDRTGDTSLYWLNFFFACALCNSTGYRKAEITVPSHETFTAYRYMSRSNLCWIFNGVEVPVLTSRMLQNLGPHVVACVNAAPSKADQYAERYGNYYNYVRYEESSYNLAFVAAQLERAGPCPVGQRHLKPLVCAHGSTPFTPSQLDHLFRDVLHAVSRLHPAILPMSKLSCYSWHSWRITLATALGAANVPRATILFIMRWASELSLNNYVRPTSEQFSAYVQNAHAVSTRSAMMAVNRRPVVDDDHFYEDMPHIAALLDPQDPTHAVLRQALA